MRIFIIVVFVIIFVSIVFLYSEDKRNKKRIIESKKKIQEDREKAFKSFLSSVESLLNRENSKIENKEILEEEETESTKESEVKENLDPSLMSKENNTTAITDSFSNLDNEDLGDYIDEDRDAFLEEFGIPETKLTKNV